MRTGFHGAHDKPVHTLPLRQEFEATPPDLMQAQETAICIEEELDGFPLA